jgi:hypothetical protein
MHNGRHRGISRALTVIGRNKGLAPGDISGQVNANGEALLCARPLLLHWGVGYLVDHERGQGYLVSQ